MIVVTGATGNIGRALVAQLAATGARVTGVSRGVAGVGLPAGVPHAAADLGDLVRMRTVLDGADALFLLVAGEQLTAGADPAQLCAAARAAGVRRVVLLSSQAVATRPDAVSHARLRAFEAALRECDLGWTILRPGGFDSNALAWAPSVRADRLVAAPFGDVGLPLVDPADIAAVAARALVEPGHAGRVYELTGPAPVSPREQAAALGAALGTPVRFVELTAERARAAMLRFMPDAVVDGTLAILGTPTDAERRVSPDIARVLGRRPRSFAEWAAEHAALFTE